MAEFTFRINGEDWVVESASPEQARQSLEKNRTKAGIAPDAAIEFVPPEPPPQPEPQVDMITPTPEGDVVFPEQQAVPEFNKPGTPAGKEAISFGADEQGAAELAKMSGLDQFGTLAADVGINAANFLGIPAAAEPHFRKLFKKENNPLTGIDFESMLPEQTMDQRIEESRHRIGTIGQLGSSVLGGGLISKLFPWTAPASYVKGPGAKKVLGRTATDMAESSAAEAANAAMRGEDPLSAAIEGGITSIPFSGIEEGVRIQGLDKVGKKIRQTPLSKDEKNLQDMSELSGAWLEGADKTNLPPDADVRTQMGPRGAVIAQNVGDQNIEAFTNLKQKAQQSRDEQFDRAQKEIGDLDSPTAMETSFREQRNSPVLIQKYTNVLQSKFPGAMAYIPRVTRDPKTAKVSTKYDKVVVPRLFKDVLDREPTLFDAYQSARNGQGGGKAIAKSWAAKRKAQGIGDGTPGETEIEWHTVLKLAGSDDMDAKNLGEILKNKMRGHSQGLDALIDETHVLGMQERAAKLGADIYKDPKKIDADLREVRSDSQAWEALKTSYISSFLQDFEGGKIPKSTDKIWNTAEQILGPEHTDRLRTYIAQQNRQKATDMSLLNREVGVGDKSKSGQSHWAKLARGTSRLIGGWAGLGPVGLLAAMGPAAAPYLKNAPDTLNPAQVKGLFDVFSMKEPLKVKKNVIERSAYEGRVTPSAATTVTEERRKERKRNRGQQ